MDWILTPTKMPFAATINSNNGFALTFNGGISQGQSNFLQNGGDYPFLNHMLTAQSWAYVNNSGWPKPNELGANGYPVSTISNGGVATVFQIPSQTNRPGSYTVVTNGKGTIAASGLSSTAVNGTGVQTVISAAALAAVTSVAFQITATDATNPISYVAFVFTADIAGISAGNVQSYLQTQLFNAQFLAIKKQVNWGVERFLNWQNGNFSNETNWASRKPLTHWSYGASQFPNALYAGATTSVLNDYSISFGSGGPVDKQQIIINLDTMAVTCSSGANANIAWTGHGLITGQPFNLFTTFAGSAPGGVTIFSGGSINFYAIVIDANNIQFASSYANAIANTAITTSTTGSGLLAHATIVTQTVTVSVASSNITFPLAHLLSVGEPVGLGASTGTLTNLSNGGNYYAIISSPTVIQLAASAANAIANIPITFAGTASGTYTATRKPTLNLNSTGAIPIVASNGLPLTNTGNNGAIMVKAISFQNHLSNGVLTYDADLNVWLKDGLDDEAGPNAGIGSSVPPEICFTLAARLGEHPYFVSPRLTLDSGGGLTDYMPNLMAYCKANAPAWMVPRFEGYNELWNSITPGTFYGTCKSFAHWGITEFAPHNWCGRNMSLLGQAAKIAYGSLFSGYQILVGVQTTTFSSTGGAASSNARLTSAQFVSNGPTPPAGYAQDPAYKWCNRVCCAQYITPSLYGSGTETTMANTWVTNGSSPTDAALTAYVDSLDGAASGFNLAATLANYQFIFTWAQGQGVSGGWAGQYQLGMCGYEGGYSPSLNAAGNNVNNFRVASKFVADVGIALTGGTFADSSVIVGTYNDFTGAGGEFPSCFQLAGGSGAGIGTGANAWSVLDPNIYLSPQPAQFTAIAAYN